MVWEERRERPNVNPKLSSPPPGFEWPEKVGWQGTKEEAEHFMTRADTQRMFDQIANRQLERHGAREAGQ